MTRQQVENAFDALSDTDKYLFVKNKIAQAPDSGLQQLQGALFDNDGIALAIITPPDPVTGVQVIKQPVYPFPRNPTNP